MEVVASWRRLRALLGRLRDSRRFARLLNTSGELGLHRRAGLHMAMERWVGDRILLPLRQRSATMRAHDRFVSDGPAALGAGNELHDAAPGRICATEAARSIPYHSRILRIPADQAGRRHSYPAEKSGAWCEPGCSPRSEAVLRHLRRTPHGTGKPAEVPVHRPLLMTQRSERPWGDGAGK